MTCDWTLTWVHMWRPIQDLSTHTHTSANTSRYSLCSCLITDDWSGGQRMKERREQEESKNWKIGIGRGWEEKERCNWCCFLFAAVRKGPRLLSGEVFTLLLLTAKECNGEWGERCGADNCIQYFHSTIILTVKLNSWPGHHFSNSLLFLDDGKLFFFFSLLSGRPVRNDSSTFLGYWYYSLYYRAHFFSKRQWHELGFNWAQIQLRKIIWGEKLGHRAVENQFS